MPNHDIPKDEYIEQLFTSIAPRYDLLNSILSFNRHKYWRAFAVRQCRLRPGDRALDVCAGTLDFAIELAKAVGESGEVVGVDFCHPMLEIGRRKLERRRIGNISTIEADAQDMPLPSDSFQAAAIGFALRNVSDVEKTLAEMARVVKPGGRVVCLELAKPRHRIFKRVYGFYFYRILPIIGGLINGRGEAYKYLPESLTEFLSREELAGVMEKIGLENIEVHDLTGGVVAVHIGTKK